MELNGRVAIVTGAAGGIGGATVKALAGAGASLAAVDVDGDRLRDAGLGAGVLPITADLAAADAPARVVAETVAHFGRVDIVVNNAATGPRQPPLDIDSDVWDRVLAVNLRAPYLLAREAARHMIAQGDGGKIVNVSSASAVRGVMTNPCYSASKAAIDGLTRSLAANLGQHDINVNAVAPGLTNTRMGAGVGTPEEMQRAVEDGPLANFLRRVSEPEDVAAAILWLCLPASRQLSGQIIHTSAGNIV